jgi:hypothetical protein
LEAKGKAMKLYDLLFESAENDSIAIIGYHRSNNPDFSQSDITMEPRLTRQSKGGNPNEVGFYFTMPKMNVRSIEDLPDTLEGSSEVGKHYGNYLYKITINVPRGQILLNLKMIGSTRISPSELTGIYKGNKFIYVPRGFPTAEGVVLDPSIITSVEKIEESENEHTKTIN